jgi:hypothetical protein
MADNNDSKMKLNQALNKINDGNTKQELEKIKNNEAIMGNIADAIKDNPEIAAMAPKLAGDPRVKKFMEDNPNMNRKQALAMKKQMNKASAAKRRGMQKCYGVVINAGRKIKNIEVVCEDGKILDKEISHNLGCEKFAKLEIDELIVYYNPENKVRNKRIERLFTGKKLGSQVVIFRTDLEKLIMEDIVQMENKK